MLSSADNNDLTHQYAAVLESPTTRPWLVVNALDIDGDGMEAWLDKCDTMPQADPGSQPDADNDGIGDACDPCPFNPDNGDDDGDKLFNCKDPCPQGDEKDNDNDGYCGVNDQCPDSKGLGNGEPGGDDGDFDGDGVCNDEDLCPKIADLHQNANLRSELARAPVLMQAGLPVHLADRCEPVPVPDFQPKFDFVNGALIPCVGTGQCQGVNPCTEQCPGLTLDDGAFANCGIAFRNELHVKPLRSQGIDTDLQGNEVFNEIPDVPTTARFCHKSMAQVWSCVSVATDTDDSFLTTTKCADGCADPETQTDRFHRISFSEGGPSDPDATVPLEYDFVESFDFPSDPTHRWVWDYNADFQRWSATGQVNLPASPAGLQGSIWLHATTNVGTLSDPSGDDNFKHGSGLANHYEGVEGNLFTPEDQDKCSYCVAVKDYDPAGGAGTPPPPPPPSRRIAWRHDTEPSGGYQRTGALRGEADVVANVAAGMFAVASTTAGDCSGEIANDRIGEALAARFLDPYVIWVNAAEPSSLHGDESAPLVVGLDWRTGGLVDTVASDGTALLADEDRGVSSGPFEVIPDVTGFAASYSRARRGIFVVGGNERSTGLPSHGVWFAPLDDSEGFKAVPKGSYSPETVLATTYDFASDRLYVLDQVADSCRTVELLASRNHALSTSLDGAATLEAAVAIAVPATIPVSRGNAGNGTAVLTLSHTSNVTS